jgi:hypothetical protein
MAVAKSFQSMEIITEPYKVSGRMYVKVRNPKTGTERQVRWYTDQQYEKMYGVEAPTDHSNDPYWKSQKEILGFSEGYITIFKGDTYSYKEWFKEHGATYRKFWGWSFKSTDELPEIPEGLTAVRLEWAKVGSDETEKLFNDDIVQREVDAALYEESPSQFQGKIGDRIELKVTVVKMFGIESRFGHSNIHIMRDADMNEYVWITASRAWEAGSEKHIKGTIKDHSTYKNVKQTILTRCSEVKVK